MERTLASHLLVESRMSARAPMPDVVTLASLHAALDSVFEIESLIGSVPGGQLAAIPTRRLRALASEMRELLRGLLTPPARTLT